MPFLSKLVTASMAETSFMMCTWSAAKKVSLSEEVVMSPSVRVFESRLDKMWNNLLMKFNYKEELCL